MFHMPTEEEHVCFLSAAKLSLGRADKQQMVVSITSYPRSGSSTVLSMVNQAGNWTESAGEDYLDVFSIFEPSHLGRNDMEETLMKQYENDTPHFMMKLANCDFSGITWLWGWEDPHSWIAGTWGTEDPMAYERCSGADMLAFKDVNWGHDANGVLIPLLEEDSRLRAIDIVRDPRGIMASQKRVDDGDFSQRDIRGMFEICATYANNIDVSHPRLYRIIFEDMTFRPAEVMKGLYEFLGVHFHGRHEQWIRETFNGECTRDEGTWSHDYDDCHQNSTLKNEDWRSRLTELEQKSFLENPDCLKVAKTYGFPTK